MHRCEFVVRSRKLKILEDDFTARSDFAECFGAEASREVQCAEIQTSEMRKLRRCVGLRCDVALWAAPPPITKSERLSLMASTSGAAGLLNTSWVSAALKRDGSGASWGRVLQEDAGTAVVSGRIDSRECRGLVLREPLSVQVFARCVHGRRDGWTSVFASDAEVSLDDGLPIPDDVDGDDDEEDEDPSAPLVVAEAGELDRRSGFAGLTGPSLVITRSTLRASSGWRRPTLCGVYYPRPCSHRTGSGIGRRLELPTRWFWRARRARLVQRSRSALMPTARLPSNGAIYGSSI